MGSSLCENKMAFITCVNNDEVYKECLFYLGQLVVPEGMEIEFIPVYHAESMTSGYNQAMKSSDAKYKVYLHQDMFLLNRNFIRDCLACFESGKEIGMLGIWGGNQHLPDGAFLKRWNVGRTYACNASYAFELKGNFDREPYCEVLAVDGMLMVTQTDIWWREDIFTGFDFYDISQSMEFLKKGYKVAVPFMTDSWGMHDCGKSKLGNYEIYRKLFCEEYKQMEYSYEADEYNCLAAQLEDKVRGFLISIDSLLQSASYEQALSFAHELYNNDCCSTEIILLSNMYEIYNAEKRVGGVSFFDNKYSCKELVDHYTSVKFILRRLGNGLIAPERAIEYFSANHISGVALAFIATHSLLEKEALAVSEIMKKNWKREGN